MKAVEIIVDPEKNRLRCFTCGRWIRQDLTVMKMFNGIAEPICYTCKDKFNTIDETEEMEKKIYEKTEKIKKSQSGRRD